MIYIECDADRVLVSVLGIHSDKITHASGKPLACKWLEKRQGMKAMFDEDPASYQPPYLLGLEERDKQYGIRVLYDSARKNVVFLLCPRLEEWIIEVAKAAHLDLGKYGLSNDANLLHEQINLRLHNLNSLLNDLRESKHLQTLKGFLI